MELSNLLTIVTPTYNRAYILGKCYRSLLNQSDKSFVWMIVDDGSSDNTLEVVEEWIKQGIIDIKYIKKTNGGKASAINVALDNLQTKYYTCLDSDDTFTQKSVELALERLSKIEFDDSYCGVLALRTALNDNPFGGKQIPKDLKACTIRDIVDICKINSEFICFYKTDIINKYRFPEIVNEKFISPAYLEQELGRKYKFLVSREKYCYCEYLPDGLTKNKVNIIKKNPEGYLLVKRQSYELTRTLRGKIKNGIMYIAGSILCKNTNIIKNSPNKAMTFILYPIGLIVYYKRFK